tara:strand:+ start:71 stop:877 length:807 start_codon:yes stop_codon:yes gene_type:complete
MRPWKEIYGLYHFEQICLLANKEDWCWNAHCWCRHMHFLNAFLLLIGVQRTEIPFYATDVFNMLREGNNGYRLQEKIKDVSIDYLSHNCVFPTFLGYLGLGLFHTAEAEKKNRVLTKKWTPQLISLINDDNHTHKKFFEDILTNNGLLTYLDLEKVRTGCLPESSDKFPIISSYSKNIKLASGNLYQGQVKKDSPLNREEGTPFGYGKMTFPDGNIYTGDFQEGMFDGCGELTQADGTVVKRGRWEKGKLVGSMQYIPKIYKTFLPDS